MENNIKIHVHPTQTGCNKFDWFTVTILHVPPEQRNSS